MFIVLLDEPGLFVFESPDAAVREIEPPDAENDVRVAFDDDAVPYRVEWIRPNQHQALFASVSSVQSGEYRFVPAGPPDIPALIAMLEEHADDTNPPDANVALRELLKKMRAVGVL